MAEKDLKPEEEKALETKPAVPETVPSDELTAEEKESIDPDQNEK